MKIKINSSKEIFNYSEPYIIAEIGANHNGDMDLAKRIIDSAKECGADAVKFQSWTPSSLVSKSEYDKNQSYDDGDGGKKHFGSLKEMVEKYALTEDQHFELKDYCKTIGIDFCSSPFSKNEVDLLIKLDVPFLKIASMDINNLELLKHMAKYQKPIILSTGMSTISEIERAVKTIENEGNTQIIILHCISIYPPKNEDIHLNNIKMLQQTFNYPIGFSDHTIGTSIPLAAVALGACVIEKHFTLDKDMPGWDHQISADPREMKEIVRESKNIQQSLGSFTRIVSADEESKKLKFRRSIVAGKKLRKGDTIKLEDLEVKRPGSGIAPDEIKYVVGRTLKNDIEVDTLLEWENLN
ncbi:N-acetylneuraminate synthase family protein [Gelidibacter sp. F63206]|uniref:N-acetylneuraminate synthase family protein n=1 Tax=Gelidibacter sp. F63206 TaxID=2926425 RepID=UPI001FF44E06|nr:N-acetylneuraminate synthase family protein [Gelidibacter sp. F63206]MCK0115070.1 N-acetylneuraminate synthase family protein [Gelidibacter sp. F63206]